MPLMGLSKAGLRTIKNLKASHLKSSSAPAKTINEVKSVRLKERVDARSIDRARLRTSVEHINATIPMRKLLIIK